MNKAKVEFLPVGVLGKDYAVWYRDENYGIIYYDKEIKDWIYSIVGDVNLTSGMLEDIYNFVKQMEKN